MSEKNLLRFSCDILWIFTTLLFLVAHVRSQTSPIIINGIEYRFEDGKWYNFVENRRADEIILQRLVVRFTDRSFVEDFDFNQLGIQGISLASPRYLSGFYVLSLPQTTDAFVIAKQFEASRLFENIHFDAFGRALGTPDDPQFSDQWNLTKIQMPKAWDITSGNSEIILAFVDLGFAWP